MGTEVPSKYPVIPEQTIVKNEKNAEVIKVSLQNINQS